MVAQIIISQEDSTSFFSLGSVQDDATLVSALGGALANFAVEMGLSDIDASNANYSKFQNGVLISKWLEIKNFKPAIMIAIRDFPNLEQYHHIFLIEYASLIANDVISTFEKMYSGNGQVPKFSSAVKILPKIANEMYKDSPSTLREFTINQQEITTKLLDDFWENQSDKGRHSFSFRNQEYSSKQINLIENELIDYFYAEGAKQDALFPLFFAASSDKRLVSKAVIDYLNKKSNIAVKEISNEIKRIAQQLGKISTRSKRKKIEIESVDLINANVIFEQISVCKIQEIEDVRNSLLDDLFSTLLQKLYHLFPLKFLAASKHKIIDYTFIKDTFNSSVQPIINEILKNNERLLGKASSILRDLTASYSPEEAIQKQDDILKILRERFLKQLCKDDPFLILVDSELKNTKKTIDTLTKEAFEQYRTAHDEAMALWYIIRQINISLSKLKTTTISSKVEIHFLQELIRKYQFRNIPGIVYNFTYEILSKNVGATKAKDPVLALLKRNIKSFEKKAQFSIPENIKKSILKQLRSSTNQKQQPENTEVISYFSKSFSNALESSIVYILRMFFGQKQYPEPPKQLTKAIKKIVLTSQSIYSLGAIFEAIDTHKASKKLFSTEAESILIKTLNYECVLPTNIELMKLAFESEWIIDEQKVKKANLSMKNFEKNFNPNIKKQDLSKTTDKDFLKKKVLIPRLKIKGKVKSLIKDPLILVELWILFGDSAIRQRLRKTRELLKSVEEKYKNSNSQKSKKSLSNEIRKIKLVIKSSQDLLTGGNFIRRAFLRSKNAKQLIQKATNNQFPGLNYYPENFEIDAEKGIIFASKISENYLRAFGGFSRLTEIYASTWVRDSGYIRKLKEEILWRVLEKKSQKSNLERKILENLQLEAAKGGRREQETIVRNTIEREVSLQFNKIVREAITLAFDSIKEDLTIRIDNRTKDYYIKINEIHVEKKYLQPLLGKLRFVKITSKGSEKTELRLKISELLPKISSRKKKAQTVRLFLRDGLKENFRKRQFKAVATLGDLIEEYIGEQSEELFISKSNSFEQLILESIDKS